MLPSPTIRLRLTFWYGGMFLAAGVVLLASSYLLVARNFPEGSDDLRTAVAGRLGFPAAELRPGRVLPFEAPPPPRGARGVAISDLLLGARDELRADTLERLAVQSAIALAALSVASIGLGWVVAGRMLRPLHEISATVARISDRNLDERVALQGPGDELKELADQFDVMLDRLQTSFDAQRAFVANASHELRTPLTIIRTELDVTLRDERATPEERRATADVVARAITRTERLIDQLLMLASADEPVQRTDDVDLAELVGRALDVHAAKIADLGLTVERALGPAVVGGDPALLDRLAGNLVENAVRHNEPRGWLSVITERAGDGVRLRVANGGPPIPQQEVERLFQRFGRLDRSRSRDTGGYGLGLSIVRAIARGHGGNAQAHARPGGGLEVVVTLPA